MKPGYGIVRNFGLFWRSEDVFWGEVGRGKGGKLLGYRAGTAKKLVDFTQQVGVYVLYADFAPVYAGQTGTKQLRLRARLNQHRRDHLSGRWNRFSWFGLRGVNKDGQLAPIRKEVHASLDQTVDHMEAILISVTEPALNRQGGPFGEDVHQYLQHRDEKRLGPTPEQMIADLWAARERK